jgi:CheY-like chemotaxis protein/phosphoribosyl 1,2-cyclic phosphodiesterase
MEVRFWGTRGSIPTPGPRTVRFGGNTTCVEVRTRAGHVFIFDCGTGARALGDTLTARAPVSASILFSHTHWDHIQGFPFFTPAFDSRNTIALYGPRGERSLHDTLARQMELSYFPVALSQLPATLSYRDLGEGAHTIGGARIVAQYLNHPAVTLGYRVEADGAAVVYACDHEPFGGALWHSDGAAGRLDSILHEGDRRHARFLADADLVIHDAQYTPEEYRARKNWGHSPFEYVVELACSAGVKRLALTHHDPTHDDAAIAEIERHARAVAERRRVPLEVFCAFEGGRVTLGAPGGTPAPVPEVAPAPTATVAPGAAVASGVAAASGARVLIVDDDPVMRRLTRGALENDGYILTEAANGREALELVRREAPDLVILDFVMPELDGLDVLRVLRADPTTVSLPVLMLTSQADEDSTRAGFEVGATDYLTKPFSGPQLSARVRACLARRAIRRC